MHKLKPVYVFVALFVVLISCQLLVDSDRVPLAKVGDRTLYLEDLRSVLPGGLTYDDSLMMAEDYKIGRAHV